MRSRRYRGTAQCRFMGQCLRKIAKVSAVDFVVARALRRHWGTPPKEGDAALRNARRHESLRPAFLVRAVLPFFTFFAEGVMALDALAFLRFPIFFAIAAYLLNSPREMKRVSSASVAPPLAGTPPKGDGATLQNSRRYEGLRPVF